MDFYHLTPDTAMAALEKCGFDLTGHSMALNSYENRVYDFMLEDTSHIVAKFYRPGRWSKEQILEEHRFLSEIAAEEIPVCTPLELSDGCTLSNIEGIYFAVWPRTGGRIPDELSDDELLMTGRLLARLHNIGAAHNAHHRITLSSTSHVHQPLDLLFDGGFIPQRFRERYRSAALEIATCYDTLSAEVPLHRIHGDCHPGNLLRGREGLFLLDFDDFVNGPAVQDIWMLTANDEEGRRQLNLLLQGYRQFRDFENSWLGLIEALRGLRLVHYAAWIARRWNDPAFPAAFPHFGSEDYWEHETLNLEDQVEQIHTEHADRIENSVTKISTEEALTNKDYFWDLD